MNFKENKSFKNWLSSGEDEKTLRGLWILTGQYREGYQPDVEDGLACFKNKMRQQDKNGGRVARLYPRFQIMKIAAAILLLLGVAYLFRSEIFNLKSTQSLVTEAGIQKAVSLEDGSRITLNQSSQLIYPEAFESSQRQVALNGEAFFEISKDSQRPFLVETNHASVEVLGTSFNIRSNPGDEDFEVYVKTGKVKVTLLESGTAYTLSPGDHLIYNIKSKKTLQEKDLAGMPLVWKEGVAYFKDQPFRDIFKGMEKLYGIRLEVKSQPLLDCKYTLSPEAGKLQEALNAIKLGCQVSFQKIEARKYIVTGKCCE